MEKSKSLAIALLCIVVLLVAAACTQQGTEKTLYVAPNTEECVGVAVQECLLVKENPDENWEYLYEPIEGFDFEPGFFYQLTVLEEAVENPPADGSSIQLSLVEVVARDATDITVSLRPDEEEEAAEEASEPAESDEPLQEDESDATVTEEEAEESDTAAPPVEDALRNTRWHLQSLGETAVLPGNEVSIHFDDKGNVFGLSGCNTYFTDYQSTSPQSLDLGVITSTQTSCDERLLEQETRFYEALDQVSGYTLTEDGGLELTYGDQVLRFTDAPPALPLGIEIMSQEWYLQELNGNPIEPETQLTLTFEPDGTISGSGGCNTYFSDYEFNEDKGILLGPVGSTQVACPEAILAQEAAYFEAINSMDAYELTEDGQLQITYDGGVLTYALTPPPEPAPEEVAEEPEPTPEATPEPSDEEGSDEEGGEGEDPGVEAEAPEPIRVELAADESTIVLENSADAGSVITYLFNASEGDKLVVTLKSTEESVTLSVTGADDGQLYAEGTRRWVQVVPASQDYQIEIVATDDMAADYILEISVK